MKNKFLTLLALGFLGQSAYAWTAADQKKEERPYRLINIGIVAAPEAGYRLLVTEDPTGETIKNRTIKGEERPFVGFSTGLSLAVHPIKFLGFETGLLFSELNYRTRAISIVGGDYTVRSRYRSIDVPIRINFYAGSNKTRFIAGIGGSVNAILNSKYIVKSSGTSIQDAENDIHGINKVNFTPTLWLGVEHQITKMLSFRFEPVFKLRAINAISKDETSTLPDIKTNQIYNFNGNNFKEYQAAVGFNFGFFIGIL